MKINIYQLKNQLEKAVIKKGFNKQESQIIANDYWNAELRGKKTHGVNKFLKELPDLKKSKDKIEKTVDKGGLVLVNGRQEVGQLAAHYCTDLVIARAKRYGIASVCITNIQRYGVLETWVRKIAEHDLVGVIVNTCEPAAAPYGATSKVLGSNPIAIGIPTSEEPIVLDMATSKVAMSTIWTSMMEGKSLPQKTFYDRDGKYVTEPTKADTVEIFGGYKGFGLSLMIEILAGSLVTAKMGSSIKNQYDIGYYFQAIDPSVFQSISKFKKDNTNLVKEIKASKRKKNVDEILLPGERSAMSKKRIMKNETIEIPQVVWDSIFPLAN